MVAAKLGLKLLSRKSIDTDVWCGLGFCLSAPSEHNTSVSIACQTIRLRLLNTVAVFVVGLVEFLVRGFH